MLELGFSIEHSLYREGYNNRHELGIANGSRSTCFFLIVFCRGQYPENNIQRPFKEDCTKCLERN